ncbi:ABC transporter ATP-binding protein [Compostimonas suwonensis]|uniref:ABC-type quaternary amine transporter n=1 Tax=Compostimonas suwonensis TaxID=1048394 RepID=A0A2M9BW79_9MICO|nr:ABC transporter ATP-binding protein [Compostimonas suwonensis]PJJ62206.1 putative spermidine/putrescine transport system ATP-binding protein [Compostimonas suwonensis]
MTQLLAGTGAPTTNAGVTVQFDSVVKEYSGQRALTGVSFTAQPGEFIALLGPSGCGKTTALRCLAGLEEIDDGRILLDGDDVSTVPANKRDMGMVFQSYSLFPHLTTGQNVEFGLRMRKVAADDRRRRAREALEMVGLGHLEGRYAHQLSGGQQQRVALARALVTEPRVLLLDEPLSALDAKVRVQLRDEIRRIQSDLGITTLFVTHDQEEALAVADRVAVMKAGNIEQIGTPEELYVQPRSAFVAEFIGLSNRVDGIVSGGAVEVLGQRLPLVDPTTADGAVRVFLRPENIEFAADGLEATVVTTSFLGSLRRTTVRVGDGLLLSVQHSVSDQPAPGAVVRLALRPVPVPVE